MEDLPVPVGVCRWCGQAIEYHFYTWWSLGTCQMTCRSSSELDRDGFSVHQPTWTRQDDLPDMTDLDAIDEWLRS